MHLYTSMGPMAYLYISMIDTPLDRSRHVDAVANEASTYTYLWATMTRDESLFKIGISLDLLILGNFWDNINAQLHEIYNTVQVVFGNFITKILHIVPLTAVYTQ